MALVTSKRILDDASARGYAVGAFNVNNLEFAKAVMGAAQEANSPVIIQASEGAVSYAGVRQMVAMVRSLAEDTDVPVVLHLDHGRSFDTIVQCIRHGFTSVMIDGSHLPFDENVAITKKVVEVAHAAGVSVEAELGRLAGIEDIVAVSEREAALTDPDEARAFVEQTGCDALAVAIGTSHGPRKFKGEPVLAVDLVEKIKEQVRIPLVLHGASGVSTEVVQIGERYGARWAGSKGIPDQAIVEVIRRGINKINIDTDMRLAFVASIRETLATKPELLDPRDLMRPAIAAIKKVATGKMQLFGSAGMAADMM
ncbi:MAG: class II fructose-1,6-bisphosphate aldolase [Bacillota bacterium]|jgi:fructose-bisphosphate aldolase class II|nr:class II fructose-1,6-bisphosphate aldolase [Bacillota bacterium]